jgi:arylsulfatase A-like enzyme
MNIIFILIDALRYDTLNENAHRLKCIQRLKAYKNTVFYENAISPAGWTQPSMSSIFSGKYPSMHGTEHLNRKYTLIHHILNTEKYITAYVSSNPYFSNGTGLGNNFQKDYYFNRANFHKKLSPVVIFKSIIGLKSFVRMRMINNQALCFIKQNKTKKFFLYTHYSVHSPYVCFRRYKNQIKRKYGRAILRQVEKRKSQLKLFMNPHSRIEEKDCLYALYEKNLLSLDKYLNNLLTVLERWALIDDTLIIVTSDHGEHFGEKGVFGHEYTLYDQIIKVPLIVKYPNNVNIIDKSCDIVSTIDIFPTIIDILNVKKPFDYKLDSISLLAPQEKDRIVISERVAHTRHIHEHKRRYRDVPDELFEKWNKIIVSFRNRNHKFIHSSRGDHEIYDITNDPDEKNNLYGRTNLDEFDDFIKDWFTKVRQTQQNLSEGRETTFDEAMKRQLEGLGYM